MPRSTQDWLEYLMDVAPFPTRDDAARALFCTLECLGEQLQPRLCAELAQELPAELAQRLMARAGSGDGSLAGLFRAVADREGKSASFGIESAQLVCQLLRLELSAETLNRLLEQSPVELRDLFVAPAAEGSPPVRRERVQPVALGAGHTLATGRPGSRHPLADARPPAGQRHSVARADEPHAETKLSSSHGVSAERLGRTLSTGVSGSTKPISESDD